MKSISPWGTALLWLGVASATFAQPTDTNPSNCEAALYRTFQAIEVGRPVDIVTLQQFDLQQLYPQDFPPEPGGILLRLRGEAATDILYSPQMMRRLSQTIIGNCPSISAVSFQLDQTDWEVMYGLVDDAVVQFRCIEPGVGVMPDWGEYVCL